MSIIFKENLTLDSLVETFVNEGFGCVKYSDLESDEFNDQSVLLIDFVNGVEILVTLDQVRCEIQFRISIPEPPDPLPIKVIPIILAALNEKMPPFRYVQREDGEKQVIYIEYCVLYKPGIYPSQLQYIAKRIPDQAFKAAGVIHNLGLSEFKSVWSS